MNNFTLKAITTLFSLSLFACATTDPTATFIPITTKNNQVVVYLYRPFVMSNAMYSPDLYVDGEFKLALKSGKKTPLILLPGEHRFELEPDGQYAGKTVLSLNLQTGNTYYIRLNTSLKIKSALNYAPYQRSFNLSETKTDIAIYEIAECCMPNKKNSDGNKEKTTREKAMNGFSINKTQNPFSH